MHAPTFLRRLGQRIVDAIVYVVESFASMGESTFAFSYESTSYQIDTDEEAEKIAELAQQDLAASQERLTAFAEGIERKPPAKAGRPTIAETTAAFAQLVGQTNTATAPKDITPPADYLAGARDVTPQYAFGYQSFLHPDGTLRVLTPATIIVGNRQALKTTILDGAVMTGVKRILIDCTETTYIDSAGMGAMVSGAKSAHRAGILVMVTGLNDDLATLWELTRMNSIIPVDGAQPAPAAR